MTDATGATTYSYDAVGNLQNFTYPNGVASAYTYDALNRLTQMGTAKNAMGISNYAYTLGLAGNRLTVAELSGRSVAYGYDSLYRLTSENVTSDPHNHDGTTSYTYDAVGNRQQLLVNGVTANSYTYDPDDRLGSDTYDNDGNTISSFGTANSYDFENHLIQNGYVTLVYDGDGTRVSETVGGATTNYLVDTQNPTGYAQVVDELQSGAVTRTYSYGLERISENQILNSTWTPSFYAYDGHGSVRLLTNSTGAVTDTYDYDAFGNLINQTGSTPNNYLFAGEQYDPALNLYYNRARYLNTTTGRFWSTDTYEGRIQSPMSLHKYLYASADSIDRTDPSGNQDVISAEGAAAIDLALSAAMSIVLYSQLYNIYTGHGPFYNAAAQAKAQADAQQQTQGAENACNCKSVLFHYTDPVSAVSIFFSNEMFTSKEYPGLPSGAYASDIEPWDPSYTQTTLAAVFYFSELRQQDAVAEGELAWFVALCNDKRPGFESAASHQFVKAGTFPGAVSVDAIFIMRNPMTTR